PTKWRGWVRFGTRQPSFHLSPTATRPERYRALAPSDRSRDLAEARPALGTPLRLAPGPTRNADCAIALPRRFRASDQARIAVSSPTFDDASLPRVLR